ncbi:MAG: hypothetical protein HQK77_00980 [Desulfobacterales bacterium]|nr:hypothetical protein [Desulfobacterales bacterium]
MKENFFNKKQIVWVLLSLLVLPSIIFASVCSVNFVNEGPFLFDMAQAILTLKSGSYLAVIDTNHVKIIDTDQNQVLRIVEISDEIGGIAVSSDQTVVFISTLCGWLYFLNVEADNPEDWTISKQVEISPGAYLGNLAVQTTKLAVVDSTNHLIHILDTKDGSNLETLQGTSCRLPSDLEWDGDRLFVSCETDNIVVVYNMESLEIEKKISVSNMPVSLLKEPNGNRLFVASIQSGTISIINRQTLAVTKTLQNPNILKGPVDMVWYNENLFVLDRVNASIVKVNVTIEDFEAGTCQGIGSYPSQIAVIPDKDVFYVVHSQGVNFIYWEGGIRLWVKRTNNSEFNRVMDMICQREEKFELKIEGGGGPFVVTGSGGLLASEKSGYNGRIFQITAPKLEGVQSIYVEDQTTSEMSTLFVRVGSSLLVTPAELHLEIGGASSVLTATGGFPPYSWITQRGHLSSTNARYVVYTPSIAGEDQVELIDSSGTSVLVPVHVTLSGLQISPATVILQPGEERAITAFGGTQYLWDSPLGGVIDNPYGESIHFKAPKETGQYPIILTETLTGQTAQSIIYVVSTSLEITPAFSDLSRGETQTFYVVGGKGPYLWTAEQGDLHFTQGEMVVYTAPSVSCKTRLRVRDVGGREAISVLEIGKDLRISPTSPVLLKGETLMFSLSGGVGEMTWGCTNGSFISQETQQVTWKAPDQIGTYYVWASDAKGQTVQSVIKVVSEFLTITPVNHNLAQGETFVLKVSGGSGSYTWNAEAGTLSATEGSLVSWTAPEWLPQEPVFVRVEDSSGSSAESLITILPRDTSVIGLNSLKETYTAGDKLLLNVRYAGPGSWDIYTAIVLPDDTLICFAGPGLNYFVQPFGQLQQWPSNLVTNGVWQNLIEMDLPKETQSLPLGMYSVYAAIVPSGQNLFEAFANGSGVLNNVEFTVK